jgi:hypothetical protein
MSSKHSGQASFAPVGAFRWTMAILGAWSLIPTAVESAPRYQRVVEFVLAIIMVAAAVMPPTIRARWRRAVVGIASLFLGLAGVVAAVSMDEAMTLASGAVVAGALSCLFTGVPRRPRHSAAGA